MEPRQRARELVRWIRIYVWLAALPGTLAPAQEAPARAPASAKKTGTPAKKKAGDTYILVGAGDIAGCADLSGAQATAKLIDGIPGTVFATGDLAYQYGTYEEFMK